MKRSSLFLRRMFWNGHVYSRLGLYSPLFLLEVPFDGLAYGIRARENLSFPVPDRCMTADTFQLSNDIFGFNSRSKCQRDQAADCLGLRGDTPPRLSYLIKDLKELSFLIFVYRHIEVSATSADLSGR